MLWENRVMNQDLYNEQCRDGLDYCPACDRASIDFEHCPFCGAEMYPDEDDNELEEKS